MARIGKFLIKAEIIEFCVRVVNDLFNTFFLLKANIKKI